jgi:hypothetical protein
MSLLKDVAKQVGGAVLTGAINKALGGLGSSRDQQGFNVNKMVGSINKSGIAKTAHFEVQLHVPNSVKVPGMPDLNDMMYRAESAELPGRNIATVDHRFQNFGPANKVPYSQTYGDSSVSFILSEDLREKELFEIWQNAMVNTGAFETGGVTNRGTSKFMTKYWDKYVGAVTIRQYGSNGELRSVHTLNDAYPLIINPVAVNWGEDNAARLQVTFAFRNYKAVFNRQDQPGLGAGFGITIGKGGIQGKINLPGFGTISRGPGGTSIDAGGIAKRIAGAIL